MSAPAKATAAPLPMFAFALAAMTPVPLLLLGAWLGGIWLWLGFLYMAGLALLLDQLIPLVAGQSEEGQEFPGTDALLLSIGISALVLLPTAVWAIAGDSSLSTGQRILLFFGCGFWLGQVGHPAAHELIHRPSRGLFRLGQAIYAVLLFGQHASAHRLVHHRYVATDLDPNSAREGEGFYRFAVRAWWGSFVQGWQAEDALRARRTPRPGQRRGLDPHPYAVYLALGLLAFGIACWISGLAGVAIWLLLALHGQSQILVSDYVQHYGLRRKTLADGTFEPVGPAHSWNTGQWFSSAMMLNAPRHSDHHIHPSRPYPALRLPPRDQAPHLPWPLPLACALAFMPRLWKRAIRRHLRPWQPKTGAVTHP